jgi:hypothetical protein
MDVLPGVAPVSLVLARTDNTVVGLNDVRGNPNGFAFVLRVRWGVVARPYEEVPWPFPDWGSPDPLEDEPLPDALLRFGVQFADGRKVTNLNMYPFVPEDLPPDQPVLVEGGGVGSDGGRLGRGALWTWGWPSSPCRRRGRWPLCAPGRDEASPRSGSRSTPAWSWTRPRLGALLPRGGPVVSPRELPWPWPQRGAGDGAGGGGPGPDRGTAVAEIRAYPAGFGFTLKLRVGTFRAVGREVGSSGRSPSSARTAARRGRTRCCG